MCEPATLTIISGIATAASTITSFIGARQDAKAAERANAIASQSAAEDRDFRLAALRDRRQELERAAEEDLSDAAREAATLRARQLVASSEQGGLGNSAIRAERDVGFQAGLQVTRIRNNLRGELRQTNREARATIRRTENDVASLPETRRPSALAAGLQLVGDGVTTISRVRRARSTQPSGL